MASKIRFVSFRVPRSGKNEKHFVLKIDPSKYTLIIFFYYILKTEKLRIFSFFDFFQKCFKVFEAAKKLVRVFFNKLFFGFFETKTQTLPHFVFFVAMLQFAAYLNLKQTFEVFDFS